MKENDDLDHNDSTAESGGGRGGNGNSPMKTKNYIPYILVGVLVLTIVLIILL